MKTLFSRESPADPFADWEAFLRDQVERDEALAYSRETEVRPLIGELPSVTKSWKHYVKSQVFALIP